MESSLVLQNLLSAPVLFFFLGIIAVVVGSDLEIPAPLPKLFSLYLLLAIGFKGGWNWPTAAWNRRCCSPSAPP